MNHKIEILITSPPDRQNLVAELWSENIQFAELSQEHESLSIQIYANPHERWWNFSLDEVLKALNQAKLKLKGFSENE